MFSFPLPMAVNAIGATAPLLTQQRNSICVCFSLKEHVLKKSLIASFAWWYEMNFWKPSLQQGFFYSRKQIFHFCQTGKPIWTLEGILLMILSIVTSRARTTSCDYLPKGYMCYPNCLFENLSPHQDKAYIPIYSWRSVFYCESV